MFFSTFAWGFTLLIAAIAAFVTFGLSKFGGTIEVEDRRSGGSRVADMSLLGGLCTFVVVLLFMRLVMYYIMPAFQGPFFGYTMVILFSLVPALLVGVIACGSRQRAITVALLALVTLVAVLIVVGIYNTCRWWNGPAYAALPNVTVAAKDQKIPPSNPDHLVTVTRNIAFMKALSALGQLGSQYELNIDGLTLQSVNKHRYWLVVLTPHNFTDTINWMGQTESPGYVAVDAEDPEAEAQLKLGFHIKLFTDQQWGLYLQRFMYRNGWTGGNLSDPQFEADDNWQPHYVMAYVKHPFAGIGGSKVERALVVNVANDEPTIQDYDPDNAAEREKFYWVDRVMPVDVVNEYAVDWGMWSGQYAKDNPFNVWMGWKKIGTKKPDEIEVCYTVKDENVYIVPMTSTTDKDHTCLGVMVFETNRNQATWYSGSEFTNFNVPTSVRKTFEEAPNNIKKYAVGHVQLMSIYGELTYIGIYESPQEHGASFAGIGLLHAHSQNSADVVYANNKATALREYAVQLANRSPGNQSIARTATAGKTITGKLARKALLPTGGNDATYQFTIEGIPKVFVANLKTYRYLPMLQPGDEVTITYIDNADAELPVSAMTSTAIKVTK